MGYKDGVIFALLLLAGFITFLHSGLLAAFGWGVAMYFFAFAEMDTI